MPKENKKLYFSSVKPYAKRNKKRPFFRAALWVFKKFNKKSEVIFTEQPPENEGVVLCVNHALAYGPMGMLCTYPRKNRMWSAPGLCYIRRVPNHAMIAFFPNAKGVGAFFARIFSFILAPFVAPIFRSLEVIPAYQNLDALITFRKSAETLAEGKDVVIFAETEVPHPDYTYVNNLNNGFIRVARLYYRSTGKIAKFYPTYACRPLRKILVGNPVTLDPEQPDKAQLADFKKAIMDEIERLARTLPPHKAIPFNLGMPPAERIEKYGDRERYSYKELRKHYTEKPPQDLDTE